MQNDTGQFSLDLEFRPAYGREDFFVGQSNRSAILSIEQWPDWGASPFLIVYGDEGSGKRHLAAVWQATAKAETYDADRFADVPLEDLLERLPNIILHQLHLVLGERENEQKLFHLYNAYTMAQGKPRILITSRCAPTEKDFLIPDLKSRVLASRMVKIDNPDDALLLQVLAKQLHDKGFRPSDEILSYALDRMDRSWPMIKKLSDTLNKLSLDRHKSLTRNLMREALLQIESA